MPQLMPYAGRESEHEAQPPEAVPSDDAIRLRQAEAELERLRGIVRNQEQALKIAGKVLAPYSRATDSGARLKDRKSPTKKM
jgi:hypothetical protein